MRLVFNLLLCLCLFSSTIFCQDRIRKTMVGPYNDQVRIVISFVDPLDEGFKMQSMIIDMDRVKDNKEQPKSVFVDLTSTVRSLSTGKKDQKILLLRWNKKGEMELKCEGKWVKQSSASATEKIVETTNSIIQNIPLNTKSPTEITLTQELEQKIEAVLNSLNTENFPCLRVVN